MPNSDEAYNVKITDTAWEQMIEHARFLANVSVDAANLLVDEFVQKAETLFIMPERCPWLVHDMVPFHKYRKLFIGKFYLTLFEIQGNTVYITAVVDCRQDYAWLL